MFSSGQQPSCKTQPQTHGEPSWFCLHHFTISRKYFKAADLPAEKKLKIKSVTEELIGQGADQRKRCLTVLVHQR